MEDDFISTLNADEKLLFLRSLLAMIKADGRIDDKERALAHELARLYDVAGCSEVLKNPQPKSMLLNEMKALAGNRKKAMLLLRELLIIAHIDDDFDEKEMSFVEEAARALEIDERLVLELNQLILDYKLLQVRAGKIMEG
ncbi:unknown [Proteobacteria bacterium CAG:495]|jgi:hypothetical protein|nr:unknown [Proteobacteria bacterium CAG:495]